MLTEVGILQASRNEGKTLMRDEKIIGYEKPELSKYGFFGAALTGNGTSGGDITEECDSDFDE